MRPAPFTNPTRQPRSGPLEPVARRSPGVRQQRAVTSRGYDLLLGVALLGATLPLGQLLSALPWGSQLSALSLSAAVATGLLCGLLGMAAHSAADTVVARLVPYGGVAAPPDPLRPGPARGGSRARGAPRQGRGRAAATVLALALAPFGLSPFLIAGAALGCLLLAATAHVTLATSTGIDPGLVLLGALAGFLGALMPYILLVHSGWMLAGLFAIVAVVSWHGAALSGSQRIWLMVLVTAAGLLIAGERLRRLARWHVAIAPRQGMSPGMSPGMASGRDSSDAGAHRSVVRVPVGSTLVVATLALSGALLASVVQVSIPPLQNLWRESPLQRRGPLTSSAVQTTATVQLGATLPLDAPPLVGDTPILSYAVEEPVDAGLTPPPLLATTLDTYAAGRWTQRSDTAAPWPGFSPPASATQLVADVTLRQLLRAGSQTVLPGLSMAIGYSVPGAQPRLLAIPPADMTGAGNDTGIAAFQACLLTTAWVTTETQGITSGMTYTVRALGVDPAAAAAAPTVLPSDPAAYGWDADTYARMTAVPSTLAATLREDARAWSQGANGSTMAGSRAVGGSGGSDATASSPSGAASGVGSPPPGAVARARALADYMDRQMIFDPGYGPSAGASDATIADFLAMRRGNAATYITTYALLLRALGYPTRLVEGFAPPSFQDGQQVVRASDFLYWVQIALPGVGWFDSIPTGVRVSVTLEGSHGQAGATPPPAEPTPRPTPTTAAGRSPSPSPPATIGVSPVAPRNRQLTPPALLIAGALVAIILGALFLLLLLVAFGNLLWVRQQAGLASYGDVDRVLRATLRVAVLADLARIPVGATPEEAAQRVITGLIVSSPAPDVRATSGVQLQPQRAGAAARTPTETTQATPPEQVAQAIQALWRLTEAYQHGRFGTTAGRVEAPSALTHNELADCAFALRLVLYPHLLRILWATLTRRGPHHGSQVAFGQTPLASASR